jgi:hypothetical protein
MIFKVFAQDFDDFEYFFISFPYVCISNISSFFKFFSLFENKNIQTNINLGKIL